jgi:Smg protein
MSDIGEIMQKKEALMLLQMIQEATQWLMGLTEPNVHGLQTPEVRSLRIFSEDECESLSLASRRFLLSLEQQGILDAAARERIIHHAMQLQVKNIDLHVIEGITRIVLSKQPESANALKRMDLLMVEVENHTIQ